MTSHTVDSVKSLRDRTGAGMMDCKAALQSAGGDIEKAIDLLRKKGVAQAAKRAGREAREGIVASHIHGNKAALVEVNCETDFVARTDDFKALADLALQETLAHGEKAVSSEKLTSKIAELSGKIGEKILVRRTKLIHADSGVFFTYIHSNSKLGVIVEILASAVPDQKKGVLEELGKNIAMQVAASSPLCITRAEVPAAVLEREKAIFKEEAKGKPENIIEKIVQGKVDKFYQAQCLLEQPFIKDDKVSVKTFILEAAKKIGGTVEVKQFVRFQLGESITP